MAYRYAEELRDKYIKVHALAERGVEGEQKAAGVRRAALEETYPGLGVEALRWRDEKERKEKEARAQPQPPPPPTPAAPVHTTPGGFPNLGKWSGVLEQAFQTASRVAETALNTELGRRAAEMSVQLEEPTKRDLQAGRYKLGVVAAVEQLQWARANLTDAQKQAFAKAVGERVAARVYTLLIG